MLNCCIGRKKAQEELARNPQSMNINESETGERFFDKQITIVQIVHSCFVMMPQKN